MLLLLTVVVTVAVLMVLLESTTVTSVITPAEVETSAPPATLIVEVGEEAAVIDASAPFFGEI